MTRRMVIVSGGGSGIGRQAALLAGASGMAVAVLDADGVAARRTAAEVSSEEDVEALGLECDVTDEDAVRHCVERAGRELGAPPTGMVAAAGVDIGGPAHAMPASDWRRVLDVNLTGSYLLARTVIGALLEAGAGGSLVLCSSPAAFVAFAAGGASSYAASKGGVSALVRTLAVDYGSHGIRVNAIVPGPTETPLMWASVPEGERTAMAAQVRAEVPLGRIADPVEPARAALWLLGPDSSYVTGSQLVCDGGVLAKASISV